MTVPRQVLASRSYALARRCAQRQFLLRPDPRINQIFLYCLGEAVARHGVTLHGYMAMINHFHLVVRDNLGNLPSFMARLNRMIATAVNAYWGRWENLWAAQPASAVYLVGAEDRFAKLVYLLANPVASQLVERVAEWPGASSLEQNLSGRSIIVARPKGFFRPDGKMPDQVTLSVERVEGFEYLTEAQWTDKLARAVGTAEDIARDKRAEKQLRVLGREAILHARHTDRPDSIEERRGRRPHVACSEAERRKRELAALREFRTNHREARDRLRDGDRAVKFPEGTYRMKRLGLASEQSPETNHGAPAANERGSDP
jgi:putative transposase